ncbi:cytochrome b5 [Pestalotiopsis fici W106-1]|uniref:Cytochrome b5 n=1 Tax=Pestalotiopsis fici (strain W106-1 / CGMCC3.15140) TaxID=1229662 RepID=W3WVZ9_PESFW|nr:cytochrome b5 [Pestalotiopsis fici W106-1]ETS78035.1 cytochrome b5 [Pestalotiopsis fici W106-1]
MADKEYTYQDVAEHNTKKDLFMVIHDKIYDCTKFVDEHPGGEEVMLDVGGQDATEAFEDVGHSDEARETLEQLLVGTLKRQPGDPSPTASKPSLSPQANTSSAGLGTVAYAVVFIGGLAAFGAYQYLQSQQEQQA